METGKSRTPQFASAEYAPRSSLTACSACKGPITEQYYQIKGASVCAACAEQIRAQLPRDSHAAFLRALVFGIAGALVGFALYVAFALATGLIIGWVSLAVGFIVGKAMHLGSRGVGGRRYQLAAVLLTYLAVSMSAVPIALERSHPAHPAQPQASENAEARPQGRSPASLGKAVATLVLIGIASPVLELQDPIQGLIGLVILFVGLRFAWTFTAARTVEISGPHSVLAAGPA